MPRDELGNHFWTGDSLSLPSFCVMSAILKTRTSTFPSKHCYKRASLHLFVDVMTLCDILSIEPWTLPTRCGTLEPGWLKPSWLDISMSLPTRK